MILPAQHIRKLCQTINLITPYYERGIFEGMSFGLGPATYDCRIRQTMRIQSHGTALASTIEHVSMPDYLRAAVCDKSSWARRFLTVQNTKIAPGFCGHITLELANHSDVAIDLREGMPIMQLEFAQLLEPTEMPYKGKYQNQPDEITHYKPAKGTWE